MTPFFSEEATNGRCSLRAETTYDLDEVFFLIGPSDANTPGLLRTFAIIDSCENFATFALQQFLQAFGDKVLSNCSAEAYLFYKTAQTRL